MSQPRYFMQEALKMAPQGLERGELPIGAVVVFQGQIIAAAHTQEYAQGRLLVHAELLALEIADKIKPLMPLKCPVMVPWLWCKTGSAQRPTFPIITCPK
ncbi:hypothetical protein COW36_17120 [bacterium (Candidatus Blackallbacteria) CG17_big_fil_post_rev_8_21_14_2_50_48_46]|uniref:CMP/dCMP-type deaminase domain-containing protein n=1 Tax=bacterium (Candidatus Blackallbacteria) CG17_big_fil_post_rev_8_21_14_2_50_48_46 TaxID=2014261 RepID=A0A2M7G1E9_9BACT|nr:MAG: hypothetical protein COW64_09430 [bacterium (Candidatus Blackallbacteria) CG18_big_fil_WC_8_21_14_2_50_49_26]PIW15523.1 MAG: hypothetical protein COW36_17120 [bacterium (Candidatus Blackallbacteria) CG17_big_fil_post_rev_8_21_14_2_50_48_46]PIW48576.1 MAG: hypothetical protein COW20_08720 [bacterium (Candidatus Blackallbacteria) CG13_big_fil_rev_8_21_14_2_50_49_14]